MNPKLLTMRVEKKKIPYLKQVLSKTFMMLVIFPLRVINRGQGLQHQPISVVSHLSPPN